MKIKNSQRTKTLLEINLTKEEQDFYIENFKTLLRKMKYT